MSAANEWPWTAKSYDPPQMIVESARAFVCTTNHGNDEANAALIANSPADLAWLIYELRSARKDSERLDFLNTRCAAEADFSGTEHVANSWSVCGPFLLIRDALDDAMLAKQGNC